MERACGGVAKEDGEGVWWPLSETMAYLIFSKGSDGTLTQNVVTLAYYVDLYLFVSRFSVLHPEGRPSAPLSDTKETALSIPECLRTRVPKGWEQDVHIFERECHE